MWDGGVVYCLRAVDANGNGINMEMQEDKMAPTERPLRVIALEEAFLHPRLMSLFPVALQQKYAMVQGRLMDVGPERIKRMDAAGIDLQVLSHVEPGVQCLGDPSLAIDVAKEVNDWLGQIVQMYPSRFAGFATLPTQSPEDAALELKRTVTQHGFVGGLINGHTHGRYLDHESFAPLWEQAQQLNVPIYIHPTDPPADIARAYYDESPSLITGWGWHVETGTHLLKLITGGVFDAYPDLKIIVGHMGELLPFCFPRLNKALTMGEWVLSTQEAKANIPGRRVRMEKSFSYYMRNHVYVTTSGVFEPVIFACALHFLGIENLLFSVDDPFQDNMEAVEFLHQLQLEREDKAKLAYGNAERILPLIPRQNNQNGIERKEEASDRASAWYAFRAKAKSKLGRTLLSFLLK